MPLMAAMGVLLIVGLALSVLWSGVHYVPWRPGRRERPEDNEPEVPHTVPSVGGAATIYLRGAGIALVAGFWTGALVTGPAMRLIMRLLAVTAGPEAQGRLTEAEEVVGNIDFGGTMGLYVFGGILPGLLSGAMYVLIRRWLPAGRAGGVVFGLLHLVIAATRVDPLRPGNEDFGIVGPGWLSVLTFGLATIVHGVAIVAFANRFSRDFPPRATSWSGRLPWLLPLVPPLLILIPGAFLLIFIGAGLFFSLGALRLPNGPAITRSKGFLMTGRLALVAVTLVCLPGTVSDLVSIVRNPPAASTEVAGVVR